MTTLWLDFVLENHKPQTTSSRLAQCAKRVLLSPRASRDAKGLAHGALDLGDDPDDLYLQALYLYASLRQWRAPQAHEVRARLKSLMKELRRA
jgi:hypothetical protein